MAVEAILLFVILQMRSISVQLLAKILTELTHMFAKDSHMQSYIAQAILKDFRKLAASCLVIKILSFSMRIVRMEEWMSFILPALFGCLVNFDWK
jgi:hypothetical protein